MSPETLKIALVQTDIYWETIDANLNSLEEKLWALKETVDLIVLPETFNTGFSINTKLAEVPNLKTHRWMLQIAEQKNALVGGSYLVNDKGHFYNRFLFAFPDGRTTFYDKKYLFTLSEERKRLSAGSKRMIVDYKGWRICPMICYDLRFPEWSRNSYNPENKTYLYDLLIYSANWPQTRIQAWNALLKARAIENQSYVIGVNRIGEDGNGYEFKGQSQVIDFLGNELKNLGEKESIEIIKIQKKPQEEFRKKYPFLRDA